MIIDKHKLIFVHNPKCAGTSINKFFGRKSTSHKTARELIPAYCKEGFTSFAVVRNPVELLQSSYSFWFHIADAEVAQQKPYFKYVQKEFREACPTFAEFIDKLEWLSLQSWANGHFRPQHCYLCDDFGNVIVDDILRLENIDAEWKLFIESHNIPHEALSKSNVNQVDEDTTLTEHIVSEIYRIYRKDFELFSYQDPRGIVEDSPFTEQLLYNI